MQNDIKLSVTINAYELDNLLAIVKEMKEIVEKRLNEAETDSDCVENGIRLGCTERLIDSLTKKKEEMYNGRLYV